MAEQKSSFTPPLPYMGSKYFRQNVTHIESPSSFMYENRKSFGL